jgi:ATP-dependent Lhr-like helicase
MIFLETGRDMRIDIHSLLSSLRSSTITGKLYEAARDTELFRYKFITIAKLFGVIDREASVSKSLTRRLLKLFEGTPLYAETTRELMQNYFDIETLKGLADGIASGAIKIEMVKVQYLSPVAKAILDSAYYTKELIMPLLPSDAVIDSFVGKVMSKSIELLCTYCGFHFRRKLSEIRDMPQIKCPGCASPMVTTGGEENSKVVMRRAEGKRLTAAERERLKEIMKVASLFESYGGKAAVAMSTYGVGPSGAAKALRMLRREDRLFYMDLIDAQKNFIRTKKYWSV